MKTVKRAGLSRETSSVDNFRRYAKMERSLYYIADISTLLKFSRWHSLTSHTIISVTCLPRQDGSHIRLSGKSTGGRLVGRFVSRVRANGNPLRRIFFSDAGATIFADPPIDYRERKWIQLLHDLLSMTFFFQRKTFIEQRCAGARSRE